MPKTGLDKLVYGVLGLSVLIVLLGIVMTFNPETAGALKRFFTNDAGQPVAFETLVVDATQDHYLSCPEDICLASSPDDTGKVYQIEPGLIRSRLLSYVDSRANIKLRDVNLEIMQFEFTEQSPNMRLPDLITVRIIDIGGGLSMLAIYSRSVLDSGRPGINRERVERWLEELTRPA